MKRAVVLLSGGLDSATTLALALRDGFEAHALSFDYGQRHKLELNAARRIVAAMRIRPSWASSSSGTVCSSAA